MKILLLRMANRNPIDIITDPSVHDVIISIASINKTKSISNMKTYIECYL